MYKPTTFLLFNSLLLVTLACHGGELDPDALDESDGRFDTAKADGFCAVEGSDVAAGILAFANDLEVTVELLDRSADEGGVGLHRYAAEGIAAGRPYEDLESLDAVPFVGPYACAALQVFACEERGLCEPDLSIATWNLRTFPLADVTVDRAAAAILELDADIIGIQEVSDADAFEELVLATPGYSGVLAEPGFYTGVGALYRDSTVQSLEADSLFADDSFAFPRPPLRMQVLVGSKELTVIVVHLKAQGDQKSEDRRRQACTTLEEWIASGEEDDVVVLGDWNDRLTDDASTNVFDIFLEEPARYQFLTQTLAEQGLFSYVPFESMIDHILVTTGVVADRPTIDATVVRLDQQLVDYEATVSDHLPVKATLSVRGPGLQ